jgi:hypothetical protein
MELQRSFVTPGLQVLQTVTVRYCHTEGDTEKQVNLCTLGPGPGRSQRNRQLPIYYCSMIRHLARRTCSTTREITHRRYLPTQVKLLGIYGMSNITTHPSLRKVVTEGQYISIFLTPALIFV